MSGVWSDPRDASGEIILLAKRRKTEKDIVVERRSGQAVIVEETVAGQPFRIDQTSTLVELRQEQIQGVVQIVNGGTGAQTASTAVQNLVTAPGMSAFLLAPTSANLATAVTDETGTGALVFANGPTLVAPTLGTPASGNLANCTGVTVAGGGTGFTTYDAGDMLYASGTTSIAKLPIPTPGTYKVMACGASTNPSWEKCQLTEGATKMIEGTLPVVNGGTGGGTAADARSNLSAALSGINTDISELRAIGMTTHNFPDSHDIGFQSTTPSGGLDLVIKAKGNARVIINGDADNSDETKRGILEVRGDGSSLRGVCCSEGLAGGTIANSESNQFLLYAEGSHEVGIGNESKGVLLQVADDQISAFVPFVLGTPNSGNLQNCTAYPLTVTTAVYTDTSPTPYSLPANTWMVEFTAWGGGGGGGGTTGIGSTAVGGGGGAVAKVTLPASAFAGGEFTIGCGAGGAGGTAGANGTDGAATAVWTGYFGTLVITADGGKGGQGDNTGLAKAPTPSVTATLNPFMAGGLAPGTSGTGGFSGPGGNGTGAGGQVPAANANGLDGSGYGSGGSGSRGNVFVGGAGRNGVVFATFYLAGA